MGSRRKVGDPDGSTAIIGDQREHANVGPVGVGRRRVRQRPLHEGVELRPALARAGPHPHRDDVPVLIRSRQGGAGGGWGVADRWKGSWMDDCMGKCRIV